MAGELVTAVISGDAPAARRPLISVVVPVYFNEHSLKPLFTQLKLVEHDLAELGMDMQLIFVNDGSKDDSLSVLLELKKERPATKVISLSRNFGAVAAVKTGLQFVSGDALSVVAADLQDPPMLIVELAKHWQAGSKFTVCIRQTRADPWTSKVLAALYYVLVRVLVAPNYPAGGFDLFMLDRAGIPALQRSAKSMNLSMYSLWLGFPLKKIFYDRQARGFGKSRWTLTKKAKYFLDTITGFSAVPIRILSGLGIATAAISLAYGLFIFVAALRGDFTTPGFATLAVLIAFFSGLILTMLGVIGEYVWRIYDSVNGKPEAVIDSIFD